MGPSIIPDDTSRDILYNGTPDQWIVEANQDSLFNRSKTTCVAKVPGRSIPPSFSFTFTGRHIVSVRHGHTQATVGQGFSFWGPSTAQIPFNYNIDGSPARTATVDASAGASPSRTVGIPLVFYELPLIYFRRFHSQELDFGPWKTLFPSEDPTDTRLRSPRCLDASPSTTSSSTPRQGTGPASVRRI